MNNLQEVHLDGLIIKYEAHLEWLEEQVMKTEDNVERAVFQGMKLGARDTLENLQRQKEYEKIIYEHI